MSRRVVITGMGIVSPIGNNIDQVWENVKAGRHGIGPITKYDTSERKVKLAGEVKDLDMDSYIEPREAKKMDHYTQLAVCAAAQAWEDSELDKLEESRDRWGVILSTGIGGIRTIEEEHSRGIEKDNFDRVSPYFIPKSISNMGAGHIALRFGLHGMATCSVTACTSASNGIGDAFRHIRDGYGDVMLAGGSESAITELSIGGFTSLQALSREEDPDKASIPFDKDRSGFVMGEGAAILVLEEYEHAKARNAKIYGEIVGFGATCDAYHMTSPNPEGIQAARCMSEAIKDAGLVPEDIDYVNAHGTSTKMNDAGETLAIHKAFKEHASKLKVSSTKSMTGHLLGASAAVEAVITVKALQEGFVPPTVGLKNPDEACDLDYVPGQGYDLDMQYAISNSFGFGGHNGCLCFKKFN